MSSTQGDSVVFVCTLRERGEREHEGRDNQSALKHLGSGLGLAPKEGREKSGTHGVHPLSSLSCSGWEQSWAGLWICSLLQRLE